jgi:hypothetical protein
MLTTSAAPTGSGLTTAQSMPVASQFGVTPGPSELDSGFSLVSGWTACFTVESFSH